MIPPPFAHQTETTSWLLDHPRALITSDPGTGKTRAVIDAHSRRMDSGRMLVLAPLSVLEAAWIDDVGKFFPFLTTGMSLAGKRERPFVDGCDIVLMNHDGVKWLDKQPTAWLDGFGTVVIDEFSVFKHRGSQRSKAAARLMRRYDPSFRIGMSGTPNGNFVTDIWHPAFLIDDGASLGASFWKFQSEVCRPVANYYATSGVSWEAKPTAEEDIAEALREINIRHALEDCLDLPDYFERFIPMPLPKRLLDAYRAYRKDAEITVGAQTSTAANTATKVQRMLQLASGVVYDDAGGVIQVDDARLKAAAEYASQHRKCVVAYMWNAQLNPMLAHLKKLNVHADFINGSVGASKRATLIRAFQDEANPLRTLLIHPAAAGHGITLTAARALVWASPTYNAEQYLQTNHRVYRAGQRRHVEIAHMYAPNTVERTVYDKLKGKMTRLEELLEMLKQ